jgi:signal transduction histidine kinase
LKDLSLHILDIIQNSIRAGSTTVEVTLGAENDGFLRLVIADNGKGMDDEQLRRVNDPFFSTRTTRRIGMGVSLLEQKAQQSGGSMIIRSTPGEGTELMAEFQTGHPDYPPFGDIAECAWMLMAVNPAIRFIFRFQGPESIQEWDSLQIRDAAGGLTLTDNRVKVPVMEWFREDFSTFRENLSKN